MLLHGHNGGDTGGDTNQSNQANSAGPPPLQKRWQQDLTETKLVQSVDTQESTTVVDHGQTAHHADDIFLPDGTQNDYTKTGTLPLESRLEGSSRRSSPLSSVGWPAGSQRGRYMSVEKRPDDAPVQSIEFDEDEDHTKVFASPVESHRGYTGSTTRLTTADEYEHLPPTKRVPDVPSGDSRHLLEASLRDVAAKLLPESQESGLVSDPEQAVAAPGVQLPHFSARRAPSPPSDSSGSEVGPLGSRPHPPRHDRHDTHSSDPRRLTAAVPGSRRDSYQSTSGRLQVQSRRGTDDFGILAEDPFEIMAGTAEFDEGFRRERRPSAVARHRDERRSSRSDSKPTDV